MPQDKGSAADERRRARSIAHRELVGPGGRKKQGTGRKPLLAAAAAFAIIIAIVVASSFRKRPASTLSKAARPRAEAGESKRTRRDSSRVAPRKPAEPRPARALREREPRRRERREVSRAERARTPRARAERPSRRERTASRRGERRTSGTTQLKAISEGTALIGSRSYRTGDVIRGRVIREVGPDYLRVEYLGNLVTMRIGDDLP